MPSVETFDCVDTAVLWVANGVDAFNKVKVEDPIEIKVRWNDTSTDGQDSQGNKVSITVKISTLRDIPLRSILWHGLLADITDPPVGLVQVMSIDGGIDVKGHRTRYEFSLARFMDKVPILYPGTGS